MRKLFNDNAIHMLPLPNGIIIAAKQNEYDDKIIVAYKKISFEDGSTSAITRNVYLLAKFGNNYKSFEIQLKDYLNCRTVLLPDNRLFAVYPDGNVIIFDAEARVEWQGTLKYKNYGPADIALHEHTLWASFPESNALIRFNLRTMREELRISGSADSAFSNPEGLWVMDDTLLVCNPGSKKINQVNLKTYTVYEYAEFEEPVYQYVKINSNEIVLLKSGVYKL